MIFLTYPIYQEFLRDHEKNAQCFCGDIVDSCENLHAHRGGGDTIKITLLDAGHIPPSGKKVYRALLLATTNDLVEDYGYRFTRDRSR